MDESTEAIEAGAKSASSTSPLARPVQPQQTYIIAPDHRLEYGDPVARGQMPDLHTYLPGDTFSHPDEKLIADLRRLGVLKLPEELAAPEDLAAASREKDALLQEREAEIAALKAQLAETMTQKAPKR